MFKNPFLQATARLLVWCRELSWPAGPKPHGATETENGASATTKVIFELCLASVSLTELAVYAGGC